FHYYHQSQAIQPCPTRRSSDLADQPHHRQHRHGDPAADPRAVGSALRPHMRAPAVLTNRGQMLLVLGAITALAGIVLGYRDVTRIGAMLIILPLVAMLIVRPTPPSIRVQRTVSPARLHPDQQGHVDVHFGNVGQRPTPLYLAEEQFDYALGDRP